MSETDDQTPRRPPTIELAATEVEGAAEKAAGEAGAPASSNASEPGRSGRRLTAHIGSGLLGAVLSATAAVAMSTAPGGAPPICDVKRLPERPGSEAFEL